MQAHAVLSPPHITHSQSVRDDPLASSDGMDFTRVHVKLVCMYSLAPPPPTAVVSAPAESRLARIHHFKCRIHHFEYIIHPIVYATSSLSDFQVCGDYSPIPGIEMPFFYCKKNTVFRGVFYILSAFSIESSAQRHGIHCAICSN